MKPLHPWLLSLHAHMLETCAEYTVRDAVAAFGVPNRSAAKLLHSAAGPKGGGWFTMREKRFEGVEGSITLYVFTAVERRRTFPLHVPSVNTVWELAGAV